MRLMFDIEFNMGYLLATLLTGLLLTGLIVQSQYTQPQRPMNTPQDVDLSDTDSDSDITSVSEKDEVDCKPPK